VYSWEKSEILLLTAVHAITVGIFHMLFSSNFEKFPRNVALGQLDSYLLKPIDSQVLVSIWLIRVVSFSRVLMGIGFLIYVVTTYSITLSFWHILFLIPAILLGLSIMYAIWFMITTLAIWFYRITNITEVLYTLNGITRFPPDILKEAALYVFIFLFPLTVIVASPAKILLSRITAFDVGVLIILSLGLLYLSRKFWLFALRFYTSASS
jgi:ABC-2 type transport system permease protein